MGRDSGGRKEKKEEGENVRTNKTHLTLFVVFCCLKYGDTTTGTINPTSR